MIQEIPNAIIEIVSKTTERVNPIKKFPTKPIAARVTIIPRARVNPQPSP